MAMDAATRASLEILTRSRDGGTVTDPAIQRHTHDQRNPGARLLGSWLAAPLVSAPDALRAQARRLGLSRTPNPPALAAALRTGPSRRAGHGARAGAAGARPRHAA